MRKDKEAQQQQENGQQYNACQNQALRARL
jgi:hypothetical protein